MFTNFNLITTKINPYKILKYSQNLKNINEDLNYFNKKLIQKDNAFSLMDNTDLFVKKHYHLFSPRFQKHNARVLYCEVPIDNLYIVSDVFINSHDIIPLEKPINKVNYVYEFKGFLTLNIYGIKNLYFYNIYTLSWFFFEENKWGNTFTIPRNIKVYI